MLVSMKHAGLSRRDAVSPDNAACTFLKRIRFAAVLIAAMSAASCAKQGYPPGGPDDKTPPRLEQSTPLFGATNVSRTAPVVLRFTESMEIKSVEDNIFIVPIPPSWPKFRWRSRDRVLEMAFGEPLLENTTYVISIGSKARDLRRNELDGSLMLSFSTGDRIENRIIRGAIVPATFFDGAPEQVSGIDVAAFRLDGGASPDPRTDVPDYVTQSGADGGYEMIGLSGGSYRLFAIGDSDRNGFYSEGDDHIGVAPFDVEIADNDSVIVAPDIAIAPRDTSAIQLVSIGVPDSRRVELYFDRTIDPATVECAFEGLPITSLFVPQDKRSMLSAATSPQTAGTRYTLAKLALRDFDGNALGVLNPMPFFLGKDTPDTTALAIVKVSPPLLTPGTEPVILTFNRALTLPEEPDSALLPESREVMTVSSTKPNILTITPKTAWMAGERYRVAFDTEKLTGTGGNRLGEKDSRIECRVAAADTLGFIEGKIVDTTTKGRSIYRVELKNVDFGIYRMIAVGSDSLWATGAVLPGRYLCRAFRDDDGDGEMSRGSVTPYRYAEPTASIPDTIVVVSRWTNSDNTILFKGGK